MTISTWLMGAALAAIQAAPPTASPPPPTTAVTPESFNLGAKGVNALTKDQAETLKSKCGDRRFETSAEGMIGGQRRRRRMTLCAEPGETDAQWLAKLENAVTWVKAQTDLSDEVKDQLVADLRKEIARPKTVRLSPALPSATLPAADALVATVPPMPAPLSTTYTASGSVYRPTAPVRPERPPLTIRCLAVGERGSGSRCNFLDEDTVLAVQADANLASSTALRILRRGETRAEIPIAALRQGQMVRVKMPAPVCSRVSSSVVTIQILAGDPATVAGNRVADELGPFRLRC